MSTKKLSFSKKSRLISSCEFAYKSQHSYKILRTKEIIASIHLNTLNFPRIGIIVAKKYIKRAHERNHIKRLIRESFRIHQHSLPKCDFVITIRANIIDANNSTKIKKILNNIWRYNNDANFKITNKDNIHISNAHQSTIK